MPEWLQQWNNNMRDNIHTYNSHKQKQMKSLTKKKGILLSIFFFIIMILLLLSTSCVYSSCSWSFGVSGRGDYAGRISASQLRSW